jgi:3-methylcrotonyl-CoA carboxylase beta subunit
MCGKAYDPRLIVGWPTAQVAVMGGAQAAKVLLQIQVASLKSQGKSEISPEEEKALLDKITERYTSQTTPYYAASRLWLDAIIHPLDTRKWISMGIEMANHAPITKAYNVGVIQT